MGLAVGLQGLTRGKDAKKKMSTPVKRRRTVSFSAYPTPPAKRIRVGYPVRVVPSRRSGQDRDGDIRMRSASRTPVGTRNPSRMSYHCVMELLKCVLIKKDETTWSTFYEIQKVRL